MAGITTTTEQLARAIQAKIGEYGELPCDIDYQDLNPDETVAMAINALSNAPKIERDITGEYSCEQSYSVYLRTAPESDDERIDAEGLLNDIMTWLEQEENYPTLKNIDVWDIEQTSTPTLYIREADGVRIYQTIFVVRYDYKKS